eukprot:scaffold259467_cov24-Tisochrysis_lutea.AAC.1
MKKTRRAQWECCVCLVGCEVQGRTSHPHRVRKGHARLAPRLLPTARLRQTHVRLGLHPHAARDGARARDMDGMVVGAVHLHRLRHNLVAKKHFTKGPYMLSNCLLESSFELVS